jgi:uncharacterized membrane protein
MFTVAQTLSRLPTNTHSKSTESTLIRRSALFRNRLDRSNKTRVFITPSRLRSSTDSDIKKDTVDEEEDRTPWISAGYKGAWVSKQTESIQIAVVLTIWVSLLALTFLSCTTVGPFVEDVLPDFLFEFSKGTWPVLGATFVLAGAAHFLVPDGFDAMVPHQGAFGGLWRLPGSKRFHVNWTGVAEIVGGLGTLSLLFNHDSQIGKASAFGLFLLTIAVTPANTYMFTNNSPGPLPPNATEEMMVLTPPMHVFRAVLQVFLLTMLWGIATG